MKFFFTIVSLLYFTLCAFAQVGIGTNNPTTTLDVRAQNHNGALIANDGLLIPRVNSIGTVTGLENGQLIFLTADDSINGYQKGFHFWENSSWKPISSGGAGGGRGQQYVGYWYIGNVSSSNSTVTNISGILTSVTLNTSLSSGTSAVYDVVLSDNFLLGDIGTDFIIVSELTTDATTNVLRGDSRTHRNVSKLTNNSFRITLNNLQSNSNRRTGITISVLRSATGSSFNVSNTNYGLFNTLSDVTTAQPTPVLGDQAVISTYNATLAHINSTTVPINADQYTIYFNGTNWVYIGWQTSPLSGADWVVAPGGLVLDAVTTAPTKATNPEIDQVRYRDLGNNFVEVEYRYGATDATGASGGVGHYLFTLPNNYQFDVTAHPIYTSTGVADNSIAAAFALPVDQSAVSENNINGAELLPIPYSATQFRALAYSGDFGDAFLEANRYSFSISNSSYIMRFTFKRQ